MELKKSSIINIKGAPNSGERIRNASNFQSVVFKVIFSNSDIYLNEFSIKATSQSHFNHLNALNLETY